MASNLARWWGSAVLCRDVEPELEEHIWLIKNLPIVWCEHLRQTQSHRTLCVESP